MEIDRPPQPRITGRNRNESLFLKQCFPGVLQDELLLAAAVLLSDIFESEFADSVFRPVQHVVSPIPI